VRGGRLRKNFKGKGGDTSPSLKRKECKINWTSSYLGRKVGKKGEQAPERWGVEKGEEMR